MTQKIEERYTTGENTPETDTLYSWVNWELQNDYNQGKLEESETGEDVKALIWDLTEEVVDNLITMNRATPNSLAKDLINQAVQQADPIRVKWQLFDKVYTKWWAEK